MTDYITPDDVRNYIGSETQNFQTLIDALCTVSSRAVEQFCGRVFTTDGSVSIRYYWPDSVYCTSIDDVHTTTGFIVATDDNADGTYSTTWTINTDYYLEPINQRSGSIGGYPYTKIQGLSTKAFPHSSSRLVKPPVKVTAKWGWAALPDAVRHATLMTAHRLFKMKDATGSIVGLEGFGPQQMRENPDIAALLTPYAITPGVVVV